MISGLSRAHFGAGLIGSGLFSIVETLLDLAVGPYVATLISAKNGEFLVQQFAGGVDIKGRVSFDSVTCTDRIFYTVVFQKANEIATTATLDGGLVSASSSYGPSDDMYFNVRF